MTGFCRSSSTAMHLSRQANCPDGKKDPYVQLLSFLRDGACIAVADGRQTDRQAAMLWSAMQGVLQHLKTTPLLSHNLHTIRNYMEREMKRLSGPHVSIAPKGEHRHGKSSDVK